jgi:cytochrome c oxidase assembly protein subunit 15
MKKPHISTIREALFMPQATQGIRKQHVSLHRYAIAVSCATFLLIIAGGLVTSTGSGLAVPDWPLSYGQVMPPMVGGILYEHGHRMVAATVGLMTLILAIWIARVEERKWVKILGWVALAAVITQGTLGGLTVLFLLPTPVSVSHATLAQSFFSLTIVLALVTAPSWRSAPALPMETMGKTRQLALLATFAVFVQLILGALIRHTESALAIPDFPLTYGKILPPFSSAALPDIQAFRLDLDLPPVELFQIWVHFVHRLWAVMVAIAIGMLAVHVLTTYKSETRLREPVLLLGVLLVFQIFLGVLTVWSGRSIETATAHVATGALLLGTSVLLTLRTYRFYVIPQTAESMSVLVPQGSRL